MIGDSLTEWGDWNKLLNENDVLNEGISGNTSYDILDRIDTINISQSSLVVLMLGINDIYIGYEIASIFKNYKKIVEYISQKTSNIIVQSTVYAGKQENFMNSKVEKLNEMLADYVKKRGFYYINVNSVLSSGNELKDLYTTDGVHFSKEGYETWGLFLKNQIAKLSLL